jgi:predicted amidohydrolase YtcJ
MRHRAAGAFVLVLMTAIAGPSVRASGCEPELIAVNGRIYTVDAAAPWVEALAVCNGRIVQTGPTREIEPLAGKSTRRIDLAGRTVLPGFNDSHVHLIDGGTQLVEVNLRDARTPEETAARLAAFVKTQRKGRWILGGFWDHEAWPEKVLPTRALIDSVTPDNPVFIQRIDGHMGLANSLALKLAGITAQTATPDGGAIVKDAQGADRHVERQRDDARHARRPAAEARRDRREGTRGAETRGVCRRDDDPGHDGERRRAEGVPGLARRGAAASAHHVASEPRHTGAGGGRRLDRIWGRLASYRRHQALWKGNES